MNYHVPLSVFNKLVSFYTKRNFNAYYHDKLDSIVASICKNLIGKTVEFTEKGYTVTYVQSGTITHAGKNVIYIDNNKFLIKDTYIYHDSILTAFMMYEYQS